MGRRRRSGCRRRLAKARHAGADAELQVARLRTEMHQQQKTHDDKCAALEAIASSQNEGYVLVLVPDEHDDDVLAEVYPLLHAAAFGERLRGFDQVSAGCLPQNCGPRTLAMPPPLARGWPPAPAEEWCFEVYYGPSQRGPLVAYADLPTGLFTREGAQRYLDAFRPGDFVLQNAPARCVTCSLFEDEWTCKLREGVAAERGSSARVLPQSTAAEEEGTVDSDTVGSASWATGWWWRVVMVVEVDIKELLKETVLFLVLMD